MDAEKIEQQLQTAVDALATILKQKGKDGFQPQFGIILGSGLGGMAADIQDPTEIPYGDIPNFPESTVAGHAGKLIFGTLKGAPVVVMKGRVHFYEGYEPWQLALPARILCRLGIRYLLATNAAGGVRDDLKPGNLMLLTDHINNMNLNPLIGAHHDSWGSRFVDMTNAYDPDLAHQTRLAAEKVGVGLKEGVYFANRGPVYETRAEVRMIGYLGGDAVGMSTVPEAIIAAQMGVPFGAISLITNSYASDTEVSHEEVMEVAEEAGRNLAAILLEVLERLK